MISLRTEGLLYTGFCADVSFGGEYTVGFQTVAEFLDHGPLDVQVPVALVDDIRVHLG